jgi:hypothetical protein
MFLFLRLEKKIQPTLNIMILEMTVKLFRKATVFH